MSHDRDWNDALTSSVLTMIFALLAYTHYGSLTHRSTWDRQNIWSPILYLLFPQLLACQLAMNIVLCFQRHHGMVELYQQRQRRYIPNDGLWFYICALLGMHTRERVWHDPPVALASGENEKATGMLRIHTIEANRLHRKNKFLDDSDPYHVKWISRLFYQLFLLYQISLACTASYHRMQVLDNAALQIDYLGSLYAFSGLITTISTIIIHVQPYEWDDPNDVEAAVLDDTGMVVREAMPDIDTSNAWVFEGFSALSIQLLLWVIWKTLVYLRTINGPSDTWRKSYGDWWHLLEANFTSSSIALLAILLVGSIMMVPTLCDVFVRHRHGTVWVNRMFERAGWMLEFYTGGRVIRSVLAGLALIVSALTWWQVARELKLVQQGITHPWNSNWTQPNSPVNAVVDAVCFLYC